MNPFENLKVLIILVLLTLAVFLGVGLYIYFVTSPDVFLRATMKELSQIETVSYDLKYEGIGNMVKPGTYISGFGYGKEVHQVEGKIRGNTFGEIDFKTEGIPYTAEATFDFWDKNRENKYDVDFEQTVTAEGSYIEIKKAPDSKEINLQPFVGKAVETNADFFEQFFSFINHDLASQQVIDLRHLIAESELFKLKEKLGYNVIGFSFVRGFRVGFDKGSTLEFLKNYKLISEGRGYTRDEIRRIDELLTEMADWDIDLWIGWSNKNLYRAQIKGEYQEANGTDVRFVTIIAISDLNEEVEIKKPEQIVTTAEVLRGTGGLPTAGEAESLPIGEGLDTGEPMELPTSGGEAEDRKFGFADRDKDGLYDTFEFSIGSDPNNADTDGDGVSDGEEIKEGTNPLGEGMLFDFR